MSVALTCMPEMLRPGFYIITANPQTIRYVNAAFDTFEYQTPLSGPRCSITRAVALGATAAVISNPVVSRRFWFEKNRSRFLKFRSLFADMDPTQ